MRMGAVLLIVILMLMASPAMVHSSSGTGGPGEGLDDSSSDSVLLYLQVGTFDPVREPVPGPSWLHARSTHPYYVVQFDGPVLSDWISEVEDIGVVLLQYLPDHAFFAKVPKGAVEVLEGTEHVRYVGPIHPAYRIYPGIHKDLRSNGPIDVTFLSWDATRSTTIAGLVRADGGRLIRIDHDQVVVTVRASAIPALVAETSLGIRWVEPWMPPEPINNNDARIANARQNSDGSFISEDGHALWSYNPTSDEFEGFTGQNVTVTVADTGLDTTHPAFSGRIVEYFDYGNDGEKDTDGHGTHVAGTVLGDGSWRVSDVGQDGKYAGLAPGAKLVVQEVFVAGNPGSNGMGRDAEGQGATISSNSWVTGYYAAYNSAAESYDRLTRDANNVKVGDQPIFYVFGAGNNGPSGGTIRAPSLAKNVLSVGATGNDRWGVSQDTMIGFSSRGPASDGRIKPDVVMPGYVIASTRSSASGAHSGWSRPGDGQSSYVYASGTSMATPGAAGSAAVITQYLRDVVGIEPSPAIIKATLINGAVPLTGYPYPGMDQGWGRIDLERSLLETTNYRIYREDQQVDLDMGTGTNVESMWFFVEGNQRLKVTLVWSDVAGTVNSGKHLINDLDLELVDPDGNKYSGNLFENGVSVTNTSFVPDRTNNVEGILINIPKEGLWNLRIRAANIPAGTQDYALVVAGNVEKGHVDLAPEGLSASPKEAEEDHTVTISATARNVGNRDAAGVTYLFERVDPSGTTERIDSGRIGDLAAKGTHDLSWRVTGVRGDHVFRLTLDPGRTVLESDEGNNVLEITYFFKGYDVAMTTPRTNIKADPGEMVAFEMTLENGGNVPDEINLQLSTLPPGWQGGYVKDSHTLDPGATTRVLLDILVPANATAGEMARLVATATSSGNDTRTETLHLEIQVNQVYGLEVAALSGPQDLAPGEDRTLELMVRNTGNGMDMFTILPPEQVPPGWWVQLKQAIVEVPLRSETTVELVLSAPERAMVGSSIEFDISIRSSMPSVSKIVTYYGEVIQVYDSRYEVLEQITEGDVGQTVVIPLSISNQGNGPVTYSGDINFPDASWTGGMDIENLTLQGYKETRANLTFTIPSDAVNQSYDFTMVIISTGDDIFFNNFTFSVRQFHDLRVSVTSTPPTVTQGQTAYVRVLLENKGNGREELSLTAVTPGTWTFEFSDTMPLIDHFSEAVVDLRLDTSVDTPGGTYDVEVMAYYGLARMEMTTVTAPVKVLTRPDLAVLRSNLNISEEMPYVDMLVRITAIVSNQGETLAKDVFVQLYVDGIPIGQPQYISSIDPKGEESLTFLWTTTRSGVHEVKVLADYNGDIDEADEENNAASLVVEVENIELKTSPGPTYLIALLAITGAAAVAVNHRRRGRRTSL